VIEGLLVYFEDECKTEYTLVFIMSIKIEKLGYFPSDWRNLDQTQGSYYAFHYL
jgi:hypothetical protein